MKFFTGKGDKGYTSLIGIGRVIKTDIQIEALGSIDELSSILGFARSISKSQEVQDIIMLIQRDLFCMMSEIARKNVNIKHFQSIDRDHIQKLEDLIEHLGNLVDFPHDFIISGDTPSGAVLDLVRTQARRTERALVLLFQQINKNNSEILRYLNRLSTLCFILELYELKYSGFNKPTLLNAKGNIK